MRALGSRAAPHLTGFSETLPVKRVYPKTQTDRPVFFQVWLFLGGNTVLCKSNASGIRRISLFVLTIFRRKFERKFDRKFKAC